MFEQIAKAGDARCVLAGRDAHAGAAHARDCARVVARPYRLFDPAEPEIGQFADATHGFVRGPRTVHIDHQLATNRQCIAGGRDRRAFSLVQLDPPKPFVPCAPHVAGHFAGLVLVADEARVHVDLVAPCAEPAIQRLPRVLRGQVVQRSIDRGQRVQHRPGSSERMQRAVGRVAQCGDPAGRRFEFGAAEPAPDGAFERGERDGIDQMAKRFTPADVARFVGDLDEQRFHPTQRSVGRIVGVRGGCRRRGGAAARVECERQANDFDGGNSHERILEGVTLRRQSI